MLLALPKNRADNCRRLPHEEIMALGRRRFLEFASAGLATIVSAAPSWSQGYPTRPARIIVPFAPGGPTDVLGRLVAQRLTERLGKQFYVENVVGAGGNIGMGRAARAAGDGYTILVVTANYVVNPALFNSVPYDPVKDFVPVTMAVTSPMVLTVHPSVPARTLQELIDVIKSNPGKFSYASGGTGSPGHLVGEQFRLSLGLDLVHVPFNSAGLAIGSAIAGHTPICMVSPSATIPAVQDGQLRALAVMRKTRTPALPDVPSMAEVGYPDIVGENWFAILVPAATPKEIIALLNREFVELVALPEVKERLAVLGFEAVANSPDECAAQIRAELVKWARVIREAKIRVQ
jgi:tripartite-type tricarboxylate transporter receptor subunit TctC